MWKSMKKTQDDPIEIKPTVDFGLDKAECTMVKWSVSQFVDIGALELMLTRQWFLPMMHMDRVITPALMYVCVYVRQKYVLLMWV